MAIVKTTFDSGSSNLSQVAAWLQANATDYFDDITLLTNSTITCTKDGHTAFTMTSTRTTRYRIYTSNGNNVAFCGDNVLFGISTSKGLFMRSVGLANPSYYNYTDVFISKTDSGNLSFIVSGIDSGAEDNARFYATDFNAPSIDFWVDSNGATGSYYIPKHITFLDADKTSIANVVCKNTDSYTPDIYQMVYSQYSYDTTGVITLDGNKYFINGCFALAD